MLFEIVQMGMHQHQMTFENYHPHQNRNPNEIKKQKLLFFFLPHFTRVRRGSCLVPAGRGGIVFLK